MFVFFTNLSLMEFQVRCLALFLLFLVIDSFECFWIESLHRSIQLILEFLKAPFLALHFSYYTLMTFLTTLSIILLSMLMIILSSPSLIKNLICNNLNWLMNLNLIYHTLWTSKKWLVDFSAGEIQQALFDRSNNNGSIDVKTDWSVLEEKSSFKMLRLTFSSKFDWGSCIISIAKTAFNKIEALIRSMRFFSPEVALYLYKSTICSCMEYCCHLWACAC